MKSARCCALFIDVEDIVGSGLSSCPPNVLVLRCATCAGQLSNTQTTTTQSSTTNSTFDRNKRQVKRELLSILNNLNRDAVAETAEVDTVTAAAPPATPAAAFPAAAPPAAVDAADAADVADPPDAGGVVDEENGKPVEEAPALEAGGPPPGAAPDDEGMEFFMDNEDIGYLVADTPPKETFDKLADFVAERASPAEDIWEGEFSEDHKCLSPPPAPGVGEEVCCLQEGEAFPFVPDELTRGDLKVSEQSTV